MSSEKTEEIVTPTSRATGANSLVPVPKSPQEKASRKARHWGALGAVLAGVLLVFAWGALNGTGRAPQVAVTYIVAGPVERVLAVRGRTAADIQSDIRSSVSARVNAVEVNEGDDVISGDKLVLLDASQQNSRTRQAMAALDAALLRQQRAQTDLDRLISLGGTVSAVAVANAQSDLALAAATVIQMQAALEQVQLSLPDYSITSPITGVVLNRSVEVGDLVNPSDILMHVADTRDLHVEVQIDELYAARVRAGQRVWLQLTGRTEVEPGVVSFVAAEVDALTGSLRVKLAFDETPQAQIGLNTVANILIDSVDRAVTVPRRAFVATKTGTAVFVLRDGHAVLTPITFVNWPSREVAVISGLADGDIVVLAPDGVEDGQALAVLNDAETGD
ncbi:efflux RND transporter periplasmic adaptor subunit [Aliiroseovarius sp. M344]|uniref:efflux RND transporter periplasmic adaptor subunit n=1 Tax=Aliiroseovarius sp. M344 TaxID=2867010 RepID=UPI0021AD8610|nr:efflux RND transporter periplasmic adaptor subunit [Aliiroseovarius sp. M344]UWQ15689.1 efflux RND transporter periplasmic adaptor subunit [Aliiroseovarius sp. M344]